MITTRQMFWLPATGARFQVIETSTDGTQAVVAGERTGGRMLVTEDKGRVYWARQVVDNGQNGTLLDTLNPVGPRYAVRSVV